MSIKYVPTTKELSPQNLRYRSLMALITQVVCDYYKEDYILVVSKVRKLEIVKVRQVISYIARKTYKVSYKAIGSFFSEQNDSAAMHSVKTMSKIMQDDEDMVKEIYAIKTRLFIQATAIVNNVELEKSYYLIGLNNCVSLRISKDKAIILSGFDEFEVKAYIEGNNIRVPPETHQETGIYLLKSLNKGLLSDSNKS